MFLEDIVLCKSNQEELKNEIEMILKAHNPQFLDYKFVEPGENTLFILYCAPAHRKVC